MKSSIWAIDGTLTGTTTPGQSQSGSNGNKRVLHISWSSRTGVPQSDYFGSYPWQALEWGCLSPLLEYSRCILQPQPTRLTGLVSNADASTISGKITEHLFVENNRWVYSTETLHYSQFLWWNWICLNPSSSTRFHFLFRISFSFRSLKLIPLPPDEKSLMKPDTFDSMNTVIVKTKNPYQHHLNLQ